MIVKNELTGKNMDLPKGIVESCIKKGIPLKSTESKDVKIPDVLKEESDLRKRLKDHDRPTLNKAAEEVGIDPNKFSNKEKLIEEIIEKSK